jgi:hypothetical protein
MVRLSSVVEIVLEHSTQVHAQYPTLRLRGTAHGRATADIKRFRVTLLFQNSVRTGNVFHRVLYQHNYFIKNHIVHHRSGIK